jgi:hypothetical protein
MNAPAKLAAFAAALAVVFGAATLAGGAVGPVHDPVKVSGTESRDGMGMDRGGGHGDDAEMAPQAVRGLAVSEGGLTLKLARTAAAPGEPFNLAFRIVARDGQTMRTFDVEHTKRMHFIVVRRDMTGFQHLHPTAQPDGTWTVPMTLPDAGSYRVFADFSVNGKPHTLADDVTVDGTVRSRELPAAVTDVDVDGLRVSLTEGASHAGQESELGFTVTRNGRPVSVQDYLGAKGHLVALRQGDLAFLHVHPDESSLTFMATFPTAGRYRLFLQFQVEGRIHTAAFTQEVSR